jgi:citronellol/citronellal dehydrogenase
VADATYVLASQTAQKATGQFFIDEDLLRETGVTDFSQYAIDPTHPLSQDLFLPLKEGAIPLAKSAFAANRVLG